ncbi:MAG: AraC family transcriptional regulator [Betaproteobacteria bacterium]
MTLLFGASAFMTTSVITLPNRSSVVRVVPAGYDRAASTLALKPLLQEFCVDLQQVLAESGLPLELFDDPDNLVPFRQGSRLLGLCADRTGCAHLGLLIGRQTPLESLGFVADLAKAAPDVRSALRLLARYLTLSDGGGLLMPSEDAHVATYRYALYEPGVERTEVVYDIALATVWNIVRALCGSQWLPREVRLMRSRPADVRPYRGFLRAPLRFDCDESAVVFDKAWLDTKLRSANQERLAALEGKARTLEAQGTGDLPAQVRRVLRRQLLLGSASMQDVAAELGLHQRTLDRKLKPQAISFRTLVDEVRYEVARQLLSDTAMPMIAIAHSLHFADASVFTRAFHRWAGVPPARWRAVNAARIPPSEH